MYGPEISPTKILEIHARWLLLSASRCWYSGSPKNSGTVRPLEGAAAFPWVGFYLEGRSSGAPSIPPATTGRRRCPAKGAGRLPMASPSPPLLFTDCPGDAQQVQARATHALCSLRPGRRRDLRGAVQKTRRLRDFQGDSSRKCRFRVASISFWKSKEVRPLSSQNLALGHQAPWHSDVSVSAHLHTITGSQMESGSYTPLPAPAWRGRGPSVGEPRDFDTGGTPITSMLWTHLTVTGSTQPGREKGGPGAGMTAEMVTFHRGLCSLDCFRFLVYLKLCPVPFCVE